MGELPPHPHLVLSPPRPGAKPRLRITRRQRPSASQLGPGTDSLRARTQSNTFPASLARSGPQQLADIFSEPHRTYPLPPIIPSNGDVQSNRSRRRAQDINAGKRAGENEDKLGNSWNARKTIVPNSASGYTTAPSTDTTPSFFPRARARTVDPEAMADPPAVRMAKTSKGKGKEREKEPTTEIGLGFANLTVGSPSTVKVLPRPTTRRSQYQPVLSPLVNKKDASNFKDELATRSRESNRSVTVEAPAKKDRRPSERLRYLIEKVNARLAPRKPQPPQQEDSTNPVLTSKSTALPCWKPTAPRSAAAPTGAGATTATLRPEKTTAERLRELLERVNGLLGRRAHTIEKIPCATQTRHPATIAEPSATTISPHRAEIQDIFDRARADLFGDNAPRIKDGQGDPRRVKSVPRIITPRSHVVTVPESPSVILERHLPPESPSAILERHLPPVTPPRVSSKFERQHVKFRPMATSSPITEQQQWPVAKEKSRIRSSRSTAEPPSPAVNIEDYLPPITPPQSSTKVERQHETFRSMATSTPVTRSRRCTVDDKFCACSSRSTARPPPSVDILAHLPPETPPRLQVAHDSSQRKSSRFKKPQQVVYLPPHEIPDWFNPEADSSFALDGPRPVGPIDEVLDTSLLMFRPAHTSTPKKGFGATSRSSWQPRHCNDIRA